MLSRYDAVLAALNAGVVIHGADTQILDANDRARELLGLVDLEGRLATDPQWVFLETDHSPMALERFPVMQVLSSGKPLRGLEMIICPPGQSEMWFEVNAVPLLDDSGQLQQVAVTFIDVTDRKVAEDRLAAAEQELRLSFDSSSVPTCLVTNEGWIFRVNQAMCEFVDRDEELLLTMNVVELNHPADGAIGQMRMEAALREGKSSVRFTKRYVTGSGRVVWGDITMSAVMNADGTILHRIAQILDVTREHNLRETLLEAERIGHMGSWRLDLATGTVQWSPELVALFGLAPGTAAPDFEAQEALFAPESWERLGAAVANARDTGTPYELEVQIVRPDGTTAWIEARGEAIRDGTGSIAELQGISLDVTDRKAARDALQELATRDPLTGLANRVELLDEITRGMAASQRANRTTAILMLDLDRFKSINDTLGHAFGDQLLVAAADRLRSVVRDEDLVARLGGDEFVIVMRDLPDQVEALTAADRIVRAFRDPFTLWGRELFSTASIGVALADEATGPDDLLREADTAMYAAKASGRDRVFSYNEDLRTAVSTRMSIEAELRHALARQQLAVWYQPEVDLATGRVIALEALLRWHHPDGTLWTADRFVEIAEDTGMIFDIGDWVVQQACVDAAQWATWRPQDPPTLRVNVSAVQLAETGLIDAVDDALRTSGLDPTLLCMELTETALLRTTLVSADNLDALHSRHISLAIDDFGTGYASLTYLHQYPVDVIKIDRSFVKDPADSRGLVAGIVALANTLQIAVTAEGVETPEQARHLRRVGCPSAQGWLFSPAVPAPEVEQLLHRAYPHE